jgi:hypothetical protein
MSTVTTSPMEPHTTVLMMVVLNRYCHLNPKTNYEILLRILTTKPKHFVWSGADLFNVTNVHGKRQVDCYLYPSVHAPSHMS